MSARSTSLLASILSRVRWWGRHFPAPERAAAPGLQGLGREGERGGPGRSRARKEPGLESSTSQPHPPAPHPPHPRQSSGLLRQRAVTASGGTWDQVHRPERRGRPRWGRGRALDDRTWSASGRLLGQGPRRAGLSPGGLLPLSLSKQARPQGPTGAPPYPGALPRGRRHTQSRVCLARERCPWLHNSPDGIRPGVFLNRAAKKCEFSVGSG